MHVTAIITVPAVRYRKTLSIEERFFMPPEQSISSAIWIEIGLFTT